MKLIKSGRGFDIYFDTNKQEYYVYRGEKLIISPKYKYSEVENYIK